MKRTGTRFRPRLVRDDYDAVARVLREFGAVPARGVELVESMAAR